VNSSGFIRGMMAKNVVTEEFLQKVCETIERQLQLWDETYRLRFYKELLALDAYKIVVNRSSGESYTVLLAVNDVQVMQQDSPYALDRFIWKTLEEQGLTIQPSNGNYLTYCNL